MANEVKCVIVSGSPENDLDFIKQNIGSEDYIIAADSGYKKLEPLGIKPDVIVADFDSSEKPVTDIEIMVYPVEKDATDTFNAVKLAVAKGYKDILILGALGGRLDHTYSNILCLEYARKHDADCVIADRNNRLSLITSHKRIVKDYKWFSVFAFLGECKGIKFDGSHYDQCFYNKKSLDLKPEDQLGQSNYIENEYCDISVESGTLLLIEANDIL